MREKLTITGYNNFVVKYKQIFQEMIKQNEALFAEFEEIHNKYTLDQKTWQREFNQKGEEVLGVIRQYENRLCRQTEGGGYGKFASNLADKFHEEVKAHFPKIDDIGLQPEETKTFVFRKINLS